MRKPRAGHAQPVGYRKMGIRSAWRSGHEQVSRVRSDVERNQRHVCKVSMWQTLRSRTFDMVWALWTMLFGATIPLLWLAGTPQPTVRMFTRIWARGNLIALAWIVGLTFREEGRDNIPGAPCLVICNHQSTWETLAALVLFPDVAIIAKQELLGIPILGWFLRRSPMIIIDRGGAARTLHRMIDESIATLAAGRSVLIFPEGTRKPPNEAVVFKRGVGLLYKALGVPVLPMVVDSGRYWGLGRSPKRSGTVTISYLQTIEPGLDPSEFAALSERLMQAEKVRMLGEH